MMNLNRLLVLVMMIVAFACTSTQKEKNYNKGLHIVPLPNKINHQEGVFQLTGKTVFVVNQSEVENIVTFFQRKMKVATGFDIEVVKDDGKKNSIHVSLNKNLDTGEEGYVLSVSAAGVKLEGKTEKGVFYGLQTLLQLLPAEIESSELVDDIMWTIPFVDIIDEPRFKWRGMHLDVCRHFVSVDFIKKQLDLMALFKMNTFHWHLTEDQGWRIEVKKYPLLTEIGSKRIEGEGNEYGGFYTQDEIKEIVDYAQERFIDVIPEIELPGHALGALSAYPQFSCTGGPFKVRNIWGVEPDVYCAGKEETFAFLEDVIDEVVALFPSEYFHIGGDECPKKRWEVCPLCQKRMKSEGLNDEHELQSYFIKRIEKVLLAHGKKMIGWDEILEGGLAPSAAVMSWRGEKGGIEAAEQGHDVVMTPGNWCYLDHYQGSKKVEPVAIGGYTTLEESYSYDPVPVSLDAEKAKHILGTQGNVWSEYMYTPELFEYRIYPRIIALAEVGWTDKQNKNYSSFLNRMDNQFVRLDMHNVNYHIPLPEGPLDVVAFTDSTTLEFTTTRPIKMVYTLDGSVPKHNSPVYEESLTFSDSQVINIRSILNTGKVSPVRTIKVEKQSLLKSSDGNVKSVGLKMKKANGNFVHVADLKKVEDWEESVLDEDAFNNLLKRGGKSEIDKSYGVVLSGFLTMPEDGIYEFETNVDQLFVGGVLLNDNDGEVKRHSRNNATIALQKGQHEIEIIYLNNIFGGWPQAWNGPAIRYKKLGDEKFTKIEGGMFSY